MRKDQAKRVNIVTLKMVRESSILYQNRTINSPGDAANLLEPFLANEDREKFVVVCLDTKQQPNAIHTVSLGSLNSSLVHPREVFKVAILGNSNAVILSHNHPSGDPTPSKEDIDVTNRLQEAGKILGIEVLDHVIIGSNSRFISLKERGLMNS
ncbi:MAG TPA: DNA repair protein RadC [Desulfosporosinus sp.]